MRRNVYELTRSGLVRSVDRLLRIFFFFPSSISDGETRTPTQTSSDRKLFRDLGSSAQSCQSTHLVLNIILDLKLPRETFVAVRTEIYIIFRFIIILMSAPHLWKFKVLKIQCQFSKRYYIFYSIWNSLFRTESSGYVLHFHLGVFVVSKHFSRIILMDRRHCALRALSAVAVL